MGAVLNAIWRFFGPAQPIKRRNRRKTLSDVGVANLPRRRKRYTTADPEQRGHYLRVPPIGPVAFYAVVRDPWGKLVWTKVGTSDLMTIEEARARARRMLQRVKDGKPAREVPRRRVHHHEQSEAA